MLTQWIREGTLLTYLRYVAALGVLSTIVAVIYFVAKLVTGRKDKINGKSQ